MLTVACVLSEGPTYNRSHVSRLERMVAEHLKQPYRFICLDDSPFPGWWAKISLFEPGRFVGRVLYLDLDVSVIGNLDDLAAYPSPFAIIENFKEMKERDKARFNSSVMAWDAGIADNMYSTFNGSVMQRMSGDQDYISEQMPNAATFPDGWCVSYKVRRYAKFNTLSKDTRVVCYHGKPKVWDLPDNDLNGFTIIQ